MRPPEDVDDVIGAEATTLPVSSPKTVRTHAYALMRMHRRGFASVALLNGVAAIAALAGPRILGVLVEGVRYSDITTSEITDAPLIFVTGIIVQTLFTRWAR